MTPRPAVHGIGARRLLRSRGQTDSAVDGRVRWPDGEDPISGIGGIANRHDDAAEFILMGATTVQVCTAVMHHGFRIVLDMIDGLSSYLDRKGLASVK